MTTLRFGIIGGIGALGGADLLFKLLKSSTDDVRNQFNVVFEQRPFDDGHAIADIHFNPNSRKLYVFDTIRALEQRNIDLILLPCFISHTFISELRPEVKKPIAGIMDALKIHILEHYSDKKKLGILTSDYVRNQQLFEKHFFDHSHQLLYPEPDIQKNCLMKAIYGSRGIKAGQLRGHSIDLIGRACQDLANQGAELIVPGFTEIPIILDKLEWQGPEILDSNSIYSRYAIHFKEQPRFKQRYKIGIIGGVGPAATVDFIDKIIRNTEAQKDQEHIKMVMEHNPQIPDRTANLIGDGVDPTIPLYATCKRLERDDADLIAIPCNTAHAYVERIQKHLDIPIVNMLFETVLYIGKHYPDIDKVGLLATTGTVQSRIYHDLFEQTPLTLLTPDNDHQDKIMNAIYGEQGVKAGFQEGVCLSDFRTALEHLVNRGADAIILGCTELPLLQAHSHALPVAGKTVAILDPTTILARKCVALAQRQ